MIPLLLLTVFLECLTLFILGERNPLLYLYWTAITTFTNLSANLYLFYCFSGGNTEYYITAIIIEGLVFLSEFLLCYLYTSDKKKSLIYSGACNGTSYIIGLIIQLFF